MGVLYSLFLSSHLFLSPFLPALPLRFFPFLPCTSPLSLPLEVGPLYSG